MTVRDLLLPLRKFNHYDGEFGIEIETETKKGYEAPQFYFWTTHADHSLRDFGIEYVLKQPVKYKLVNDALLEFQDKTKDLKFIPDSISTSVHVHVNMLDEKKVTLGNFLTTYTLLENLLIRFSGPQRLSNLFCLPICDAEETYIHATNFAKCLESKNPKGLILAENTAKYAALNLTALGKYGSLEVRSFRGETDVKLIQQWVDILNNILEYSRKSKNPKVIMEEFRLKPEEFKDKVFKNNAKFLAHPEELELLDRNTFYAANIAYAVKDWEALDKKDTSKFNPTKKDLESYAQAVFYKSFDELQGGEQNFLYLLIEEDFRKGRIAPVRTKTKKKDNLQEAWNNLVLPPQPNPAGEQAGVWIDEVAGNAPNMDF